MSDVPEELADKAVFGEAMQAKRTPITQLLAINGLTDKTDEFEFLSGSATASDSQYIASTGTTAFSFAAVISALNMSYRSGEGAECTISAFFTAGVANSLQQAGFISSTDSLAFACQGAEFGVLRRADGRVEIQELQVTSATTTAGDVTVTVDAIPYTVPVTIGTVQVNAYEIAVSLDTQVPNYRFTSNDDTVTAVSDIAQSQGAFAFALDTAVGTAAAWTQIKGGNTATVDFTPQAGWNIDTMSGNAKPVDNLNPELGNVYKVEFGYLGYSSIIYSVKRRGRRSFEPVHILEYENENILPNLGDPAMTVGWTASSSGSTTDLTVSGASAGLFVQGENIITERPKALTNTLLAVGLAPQNLLTLRNRIARGDRGNRISTAILDVSGLTDSAKGALVDVIIDATVGGDPDFQYINKVKSNTEFDITGTTVTGGESIGTLDIILGAAGSIDLQKLMTSLQPGQTLTLAASVVALPASDITSTINFQEDL